jgi:hypothetical protein
MELSAVGGDDFEDMCMQNLEDEDKGKMWQEPSSNEVW